ncbi:hypothetical protein OVY48_08725 [Sphingobium sp. SA2]|uniref:hypothetical protein n=1 Tax=Sphingobium sp. SA2 TaxID=1524832 RepID=UPI0028C08937|nr:hypothetical protein [Sphingobium sp. SA2]MDT7533506.1 hypothetical protein [Sphingobium sp. SA2]
MIIDFDLALPVSWESVLEGIDDEFCDDQAKAHGNIRTHPAFIDGDTQRQSL